MRVKKNSTIRLDALAMATIDIARLPGEDDMAVISRLLIMLLPIAADLDTFFGPQINRSTRGRSDARTS